MVSIFNLVQEYRSHYKRFGKRRKGMAMPIDYANLAPMYRDVRRAYEAGQEVTEAGPQTAFATTTERIDPLTLSPAEIQSYFERQTQPPEWEEYTDIDDAPEQDYDLGRLTIKRQYSDDVKIANAYQNGTPEFMALHQEAAATMQARMAKLNMERDRVEMAFRQINRNPNFARNERRQGKINFYRSNPVWKIPRVEYPEEPQMPRRGKPLAVSSLDDMAERAVEMARAQESLLPFVGTKKEDIVRAVKRAADMGGWKDLNPATKEALLATLDVKLKNTGETRKAWDEDAEEQVRSYVGVPARKPIPIPETATTKKPIGYPDAVWNPQFGMWTVIKKGKIIGLKEE